ncbi:DUF4173 domain-containing protein [Hymenobacter koreensis]|uniref:DUF4173 domain-containing protein n=1 Tax=Hymenobacter koreensis TaxID=1084523 RepID=A0ABP8IVU6_9BACT
MDSFPLFASRAVALPAGASASAAWPAPLVLTAVQKLLLPLGVLVFDIFFWNQGVGLNLALFTLLAVVVLLAGQPKAAWRSGYFRLLLGGTLVACGAVVLYGSAAAGIACVGSLLMLLGYANQPHLKLLALALLTGLGSAVEVAAGLPRLLTRPPKWLGQTGRVVWYARLFLVPVAVLAVFHFLFAVANPRYGALAGKVLSQIGEWLAALLPQLTVLHVLFLLMGLVVTAGVLLRVPVPGLAQWEARFPEFIRRRRDGVASFGVRHPNFQASRFRMADLRKEYLAALAVFGLVNLLLLAVNVIDVQWLWFGFVPAPGFNLAQFVHEGTYVLIFSILLAMGIVLWFFRRNLNFYQPGLPALRFGATVWVLQNAVLAVSVGLRNYYYITHMGLAYKRVGVCFFLLLTLFGLATILLKIWQRRSTFSLVRLNSLAAYAVLLALALGNWEIWIARYNLTSKREHPSKNLAHLDLGFLLRMPGRVLPSLLARRAVLNEYQHFGVQNTYREPARVDLATAQRMLDARAAEWRADYEAQASWQDWTYADWAAYQSLRRSASAVRAAEPTAAR